MFNTKKKIINYLYVLSHIIEDETLIFSRFFVIKDNVVARHHLVWAIDDKGCWWTFIVNEINSEWEAS